MTLAVNHLVHPLSGELLDGDNLPGLLAAEKATDEALGHMYRARATLRERIAELQGDPLLPSPRYRTKTQERISACPRCGHKDEA